MDNLNTFYQKQFLILAINTTKATARKYSPRTV